MTLYYHEYRLNERQYIRLGHINDKFKYLNAVLDIFDNKLFD